MKHTYLPALLMAAIINDAGAANQPLAIAKGISDKLPEALKLVHMGDVVVTAPDEQVQVLRAYIRNKVLKQFGIQSVNKTLVSALPVGFNDSNVQTALKLPKPHVNLAGDYVESLPAYYTRVLPVVQQWLRNSLFNSKVTVDQIQTMD